MKANEIFGWLGSHPLIDLDALELALDFDPDMIMQAIHCWRIGGKETLSKDQLILMANQLEPYGFIPTYEILINL